MHRRRTPAELVRIGEREGDGSVTRRQRQKLERLRVRYQRIVAEEYRLMWSFPPPSSMEEFQKQEYWEELCEQNREQLGTCDRRISGVWTDARKIPGGEAWLRARREDTVRAAAMEARPALLPVEALVFIFDLLFSGREPNAEDTQRLRAVLLASASQHAQPSPELEL